MHRPSSWPAHRPLSQPLAAAGLRPAAARAAHRRQPQRRPGQQRWSSMPAASTLSRARGLLLLLLLPALAPRPR